MANVIFLSDLNEERAGRKVQNVLLDCFSRHRRLENDVFWLKENAELLNILECSGELNNPAVELYSDFYEGIERRAFFFRQYYRFYLSICLDLEDLGFSGGKGDMLAQWVEREKLVGSELSDLQRAETQRQLARRNIGRVDSGLADRLRAFAQSSEKFALPNMKIAYELTHIVFYLSEYGRVDPDLPPEACTSLRNVGTLAFLDQNMDLLAEVCIALRYAGFSVPANWERALNVSMGRYRFVQNGFDGTHDDYHAYFVGVWWAMLAGKGGFDPVIPGGAMAIRSAKEPGALHALSQLVFNDEGVACLSWKSARPRVLAGLPAREGQLLRETEQSLPDFDRFFKDFARNGRVT